MLTNPLIILAIILMIVWVHLSFYWGPVHKLATRVAYGPVKYLDHWTDPLWYWSIMIFVGLGIGLSTYFFCAHLVYWSLSCG